GVAGDVMTDRLNPRMVGHVPRFDVSGHHMPGHSYPCSQPAGDRAVPGACVPAPPAVTDTQLAEGAEGIPVEDLRQQAQLLGCFWRVVVEALTALLAGCCVHGHLLVGLPDGPVLPLWRLVLKVHSQPTRP